MRMPVTAENNYNRNKNIIVFGPSGSGKSYSVAGPQLLQFNSNYVLSDPKGELLDTYGNVLVSQGYNVKVFNLKDRDKSDHYNPFAYIHDTDDIVVVAKNLIKNMKEDPRQKNTADPIWEEGSTSLLEALLAYVYFEQPPEMHNMNSVMELFVLMQHRYGPQGRSQLDDIFEDLAIATCFVSLQWLQLDIQLVSYIVMVEVLPFLGLGFISHNGYPFEKLVKIYWAWYCGPAEVAVCPRQEKNYVFTKKGTPTCPSNRVCWSLCAHRRNR